jgi:hypothetical protein
MHLTEPAHFYKITPFKIKAERKQDEPTDITTDLGHNYEEYTKLGEKRLLDGTFYN